MAEEVKWTSPFSFPREAAESPDAPEVEIGYAYDATGFRAKMTVKLDGDIDHVD